MPRRYSSSKFRIIVLGVTLTAAAFATTAYAADPAGAATPGKHTTIVSLILSHLDFVFFTIVGLSIWALTLIIQGIIRNRASVVMPEPTNMTIRDMISQKKFKELIDFTETDPSFVAKALNPALKRAPSFSSMKEAMETAIGEQTAEQFRRIEYLNIIGNLGPLLGLLGTVLGMIEAFQAMSDSGGQADPGKLAFGISTALTHTFLGLLLAVPCLAAFGFLRTRVDQLTIRAALVAEEMLLMVKPQETKAAAPGAPRMPGGATPQPQIPGGPPRKAPLPAPAPMG